MLKGLEWLYLVLCIAFCVYSFIDGEYIVGTIFTILTILGTVGSVRGNLKDKKEKKHDEM